MQAINHIYTLSPLDFTLRKAETARVHQESANRTGDSNGQHEDQTRIDRRVMVEESGEGDDEEDGEDGEENRLAWGWLVLYHLLECVAYERVYRI